MADSTITTTAPAWSDPILKRFVICNRDEDCDLRVAPDFTSMNLTDRTAFIFDTANRTIIKHTKGNTNAKDCESVVAGHTEMNGGGKHNEIFCDYNNNKTDGIVSYSLICGSNNIVQYNKNFAGGGFSSGHYNKPDVSYIMTVGNGTGDSGRSNIFTVTDEAVIVGYSPNVDVGKNVSIQNGDVFIGGDLTVKGTINGSSGGGGGDYDEAIAELKSAVATLTDKLTTLQTSYTQLYETFYDMYWFTTDTTLTTQVNSMVDDISNAQSTANGILNALNNSTVIVEK